MQLIGMPSPGRLIDVHPQPNNTVTTSYSNYYILLHQIKCSLQLFRKQDHDAMISFDVPTWSAQGDLTDQPGRPHLIVQKPVGSIQDFLVRSPQIAFMVFRYYSCSDRSRIQRPLRRGTLTGPMPLEETIAIVSDPLQLAIDQIARCMPDTPLHKQRQNRMSPNEKKSNDLYEREYDYRFFFHHRQALNEIIPHVGDVTQHEIRALLQYVDRTYGSTYQQTDNLTSGGKIQSNNVDMLFCPNDVVISRQHGTLKAYVLREWPSGESTIFLDCWAWGYDGHWLHRKQKQLFINRPIDSIVDIRGLAVIPVTYATTDELNLFRDRGSRFWSLRYQTLVAYEGWDSKAEQYYENESRCMIDYRTYKQMHPKAAAFLFDSKEIKSFDRWPDTIPHNAELDEVNLMLLPPEVYGFPLKEKKWFSLLIDNVKPVTWNKEAFDRLVLPAKAKDLVEALVMARASRDMHQRDSRLQKRRDDLIAGKGKGLIMLLHGGPGTGKTLSAESVAELAEMPLYSVTCGDIGTKPEAVEEYLNSVLTLGKIWNCVVLLDEADVFLEERSLSDLDRNSLVSVFLRTLEYYQGILILTSNRVGTFDEAFKSRIQMAIHYEDLNKTSRRKIWQNFFNILEPDSEDVDLEDLTKHMDQLVSHPMNRRQVRNSLNTARELAIYKRQTLEWSHLQQAIQAASDFIQYLERVHGHKDSEWAQEERLRAH